MSPNEELDTRIVEEETAAQVEGNEVDLREERAVDEATHESESYVEQTRNFQEAEAIETVFTELVDNAVEQGTGQVESAPLPLPPPGEQETGGAAMAAVDEEIAGIPVPLPIGPEAVEATPQPIPNPAEEISVLPIPLPSPSDQEVVTAQMAEGEQQMSQDQMPGTHEGASDNRGEDEDRDEATPINLPGPESAQADEEASLEKVDAMSATPQPIPSPADEISATPITLPIDPEQGSREDVGLTSELGEARIPEDGQMEKEVETGPGALEDLANVLPGQGSLTDAEGNPMGEGLDSLGLGGLLGGDLGFGAGGPGDLDPDTAADHQENHPGIDGPFLPGKGPGAGEVMDGDDDMKQDELDVIVMIRDGATEGEIASKERQLQEKALDKYGMGLHGKGESHQEPDEEDPPKPKPGSTQSTPEDEGSEVQRLPTSLDDMDPSSDQDQISLTTADDAGDGAPDGRLSEAGREKVEAALDLKQKLQGTTYDDKREQVTDPPSHIEGGDIEIKDQKKKGAE